MNKRRIKKSTLIPLMLFFYLLIMAYVGRPYYYEGEYLHYFGVLGLTTIVIILLHFSLKRKERLRQEREDDMYGRYDDNKEDNN